MEQKKPGETKLGIYFPPLGQRIMKTTVAVFLCLVVYKLRGFKGEQMSAEAAVTAIICMQPYIHDTRIYARDRFAGSIIGAVWGLIFLLVMLIHPSLGANPYILYPLMALGITASLYTAVVVRLPDASSLAAIVFICVVIVYPDIEDPLQQAFQRMVDVFIGTTAAICVNVCRLPRDKRKDQVFFVRTKDLVPDQLARISSAVMFRLNYLYNDGAKICLMSEHAPAFFLSQMSALRVSTPLIVMDGAAIYDPLENVYLSWQSIAEESSAWLVERLNVMKASYFVYTIHNDHTNIYHHGEYSKGEKVVYQHMRGTPYRNYLDDDTYNPKEIVCIKIIAPHFVTDSILVEIHGALPQWKLRSAVRPQAGLPGSTGLYFYAADATMDHAEDRMMDMLREKQPDLKKVEIFSNEGYRTEHDAVHLVQRVGRRYEPLKIETFLEKFRVQEEEEA